MVLLRVHDLIVCTNFLAKGVFFSKDARSIISDNKQVNIIRKKNVDLKLMYIWKVLLLHIKSYSFFLKCKHNYTPTQCRANCWIDSSRALFFFFLFILLGGFLHTDMQKVKHCSSSWIRKKSIYTTSDINNSSMYLVWLHSNLNQHRWRWRWWWSWHENNTCLPFLNGISYLILPYVQRPFFIIHLCIYVCMHMPMHAQIYIYICIYTTIQPIYLCDIIISLYVYHLRKFCTLIMKPMYTRVRVCFFSFFLGIIIRSIFYHVRFLIYT